MGGPSWYRGVVSGGYPICSFRQFLARMCHFATIQNVTDRRRRRRQTTLDTKGARTVGQKNMPSNVCLYLRQIMNDFQNSATVTLYEKLAVSAYQISHMHTLTASLHYLVKHYCKKNQQQSQSVLAQSDFLPREALRCAVMP